MRRQATISALLLVGVGVVLGATVFRADIAQATGLAQSVTVNNTAAEAVPVREQNLDGNQNIKVHEQGTANVNVTNSSLSVAPAAPITGGGSETILGPSASPETFTSTVTATALSIHLTAGVIGVGLSLSGHGQAAFFAGPGFGGNSSIVLALTRPVSFDTVSCQGGGADTCSVSWVGAQP